MDACGCLAGKSLPSYHAGPVATPDHPSSPLRCKSLGAHRLSTLSARPVDTTLGCTASPLLPLQLSSTSFKVSTYRPGLVLDGAVARRGGLSVLEMALHTRAALRLVAVCLGARLALRGLAELCRVVDGGGCGSGEAT